MKIKLVFLNLVFAFGLLSGMLPRPLDYLFLVVSIFLALVIGPKKYLESIRKSTHFTILAVILIFVFGLIALHHGIQNTYEFFSGDGILYLLMGFLHFCGLFNSTDERMHRQYLIIFYAFTVVISLTTIFQFFGFLGTTTLSISEFHSFSPIYRSTAFLPHSTALTVWLVGINILLFLQSMKTNGSLIVNTCVSSVALMALACTQGRIGLMICIFSVLALLAKTVFELIGVSLNWKKSVNGLLAVIAVSTFLIFILIFSFKTPGNRYSGFFNIQAKHSQRLQENYLGKEILFRYPQGAGLEKIADEAHRIRDEDPFFKNQKWIFTEWRGIHNGFLHYASLWGWAGLVLVLICLFLPIFTKTRTSWTDYMISFGLVLYCFTDNIFYREISTGFAFCFAGALFLKNKPTAEPQKQKYRQLIFFIITATVSLLMVNFVHLRLKQIESTKVVSLAIDNPSSSRFLVYVNDRLIRVIENDDYNVLFLKPGVEYQIKIIDQTTTKEQIFVFKKDLTQLHLRSFWLTTVDDQSYSLLHFVKNSLTHYFEENLKPYLKARAFRIYEMPQETVSAQTTFNQENPTDYKYSNNVANQPILIRNDFIREGKYRCYEPWVLSNEEIGQYDPCAIQKRNNYSVRAIKMVFLRLLNKYSSE